MANSNIDELLTKYAVDFTGVTQAASSIGRHTASIVTDLGKVSVASEGVATKLLKLASTAGTLTTDAIIAGATALAGLSTIGIQQASIIERLTGEYAGLTGSLDTAGKKIKFLQDFAKTSILPFEAIAEAGIQLEAAGLSTERFTPILGTLAGVFGGTKDKVLELAAAFGRLASGSTGEALEAFRRFGITRAGLESQGIKFSGGGQLLSGASETFAAIEKIAKTKYGNVAHYLEKSLSVRLSNLGDAGQQAAASFGKGFLPVIGGIVDKVGSFFSYLNNVDSKTGTSIAAGVGKNLAEGLSGILGNGDIFNKAIALGVATFEKLPSILSESWTILKGMGTILKEDFKLAINGIGQFLHDSINSAVKSLYAGLNDIRHFAGDLLKTASSIVDLIPGHDPLTSAKMFAQGARLLNPKNDYKFSPLFEDAQGNNMLTANTLHKKFGAAGIALEPDSIAEIFKRAKKIYHGYPGTEAAVAPVGRTSQYGSVYGEVPASYRNRIASGAGDANGFFNGNYIEANNLLSKIADSTRITATNTAVNLKAFALGGGQLGQMGITPVEFAAFRKERGLGRTNRVEVDIRGVKNLEEAFQKVVYEVVNSYAREQGRR